MAELRRCGLQLGTRIERTVNRTVPDTANVLVLLTQHLDTEEVSARQEKRVEILSRLQVQCAEQVVFFPKGPILMYSSNNFRHGASDSHGRAHGNVQVASANIAASSTLQMRSIHCQVKQTERSSARYEMRISKCHSIFQHVHSLVLLQQHQDTNKVTAERGAS